MIGCTGYHGRYWPARRIIKVRWNGTLKLGASCLYYIIKLEIFSVAVSEMIHVSKGSRRMGSTFRRRRRKNAGASGCLMIGFFAKLKKKSKCVICNSLHNRNFYKMVLIIVAVRYCRRKFNQYQNLANYLIYLKYHIFRSYQFYCQNLNKHLVTSLLNSHKSIASESISISGNFLVESFEKTIYIHTSFRNIAYYSNLRS